mmetsp:Transcript_18783/g.33372  ORF Transcript_18783/g.33372 Transcript_18783/m.33372 type:complete len:1366 (+) Transcript_18783:92-4189(+)
MKTHLVFLLLSVAAWQTSLADMYLNNPRGSNNKLREQSNNVQNANRLFDSQNNAASGYQIGDDCRPACKDADNNYDVTKEGATKGTMQYYQGSELYIEWFMQHGCGVGQPNVRCQIILQYMCEAENPGLRDGTGQGSAAGDDDDPTEADAADAARGLHESVDYWWACYRRERNKGLYTADRQMDDNGGATSTRQNPNGNGRRRGNQRHGLECPEERDYYPYWHPSPWHDIAVLTDEPQARCEYYQAESQNVKQKGYCSQPEYNNPKSCTGNGSAWLEQASFNEAPPECVGGIASRDNHNGNVRNGQPLYHLWKIPEHVSGRCVLRVRYNITTADFNLGSSANPKEDDTHLKGAIADAFFMDQSYNDPNPNSRRRTIFSGRPTGAVPLGQDPVADWLKLGSPSSDTSRLLQLQVNTNQLGRTFEDRTHTFMVQERPAEVAKTARIVNYNVRGRRGNIVQVYPSVEYDFVPQNLVVEQGTYLHFQWTGSDANNNNNAGNGRAGTDRSNLVQVAARGETVPLPVAQHTLLFDALAQPDGDAFARGRALVDQFAYLDQDKNVACDPDSNDQNAQENCKQLNGASAYFNGGLTQMLHVGAHHILSTRNNDFSNRSQKATIIVTAFLLPLYAAVAVGIGAALLLTAIAYLAAAFYAYKRPTSWLFSKRYRPRILRWLVKKETLEAKAELRRQHVAAMRREWAKKVGEVAATEVEGAAGPYVVDDHALPNEHLSWCKSSMKCCRRCGFKEQRLTTLVYSLLNAVVFLVGFCSNLKGGFYGSWAYPVAKGAGYTMDLNFAVLILPTLKSLQTAMRRVSSSREWIPIDDPISFHITVACFIILGMLVHIAGHIVHMYAISAAPALQHDPLDLWKLTSDEQLSGRRPLEQIFDLHSRLAPFTGIVLTFMMAAICLTAMPCARRGTNRLTRWLGGYNMFSRFHMSWKWLYVVLLLHSPARLWIWLFFPAILVAVDRMLLASHQSLYLSLKQVKLMQRDVIFLTFELPQGFAYQAGQYILLGWKGEWHPFTLTSAPEDRHISVHIRAPESLDWCSALRRRLTLEAPGRTSAKAGTVIEYSKCVLPNSTVIYNKPVAVSDRADGKPRLPKENSHESLVPTEGAAQQPKMLGRQSSGAQKQNRPLQGGRSGETLTSFVQTEQLPPEAVVLQVTGPFGAPAQKVWGFDTLMVVGAGIGVTPFASILRSVQLRAQQRETILNAARKPSTWRAAFANEPSPNSAESVEGLEKLVRDMVVVPKRIYFYWIVRGQEEFDWFYDLLAAASEGPAAGIVDITLFLTGEIELSQVKKLPGCSGQFFGRPNWARIFKQNQANHKGEHVGVFLCGSPLIADELARQSAKNSDLSDTPGGTRFSFFKEHF